MQRLPRPIFDIYALSLPRGHAFGDRPPVEAWQSEDALAWGADNLDAIHLKFTQDELKSLDEASQLPPEYPEWMLAIFGGDRLGPVEGTAVAAT